MTEKGKRVLIVEDDEFLSNIYKNKLTKPGVELLLAKEGGSALEIMQTTKPDVVLLDMIMPGMDGFDFLDKVRSDPAWDKIPVVIATNLGQDSDKKRCRELKKCSYFVKTEVRVEAIMDEVKKYL